MYYEHERTHRIYGNTLAKRYNDTQKTIATNRRAAGWKKPKLRAAAPAVVAPAA